jgi:hypothetical protein
MWPWRVAFQYISANLTGFEKMSENPEGEDIIPRCGQPPRERSQSGDYGLP